MHKNNAVNSEFIFIFFLNLDPNFTIYIYICSIKQLILTNLNSLNQNQIQMGKRLIGMNFCHIIYFNGISTKNIFSNWLNSTLEMNTIKLNV